MRKIGKGPGKTISYFCSKLIGMPKDHIQDDYRERINRVLQYIDEHLDEKLDLDTLASVSCFSAYHFHRIMRAHLNESLGAYIIRQRLQLAAMLLTHSGRSVSEIAWEVGYETPSSLSKAFKNHFKISPQAFRDNKGIPLRDDKPILFNLKETNMNLNPEIRQIETMNVIYVQAIGDYNNVGVAWEKLCAFAGRHGLFGPDTLMFGLSHDDPETTETSKLRYDACIRVEKEVQPEGEIGVKTAGGCQYAVFLHKGPYAGLNKSYNDIFRNWLPQSGREVGDSAPIEIYLNDPGNTKPEELRTEICIPLK